MYVFTEFIFVTCVKIIVQLVVKTLRNENQSYEKEKTKINYILNKICLQNPISYFFIHAFTVVRCMFVFTVLLLPTHHTSTGIYWNVLKCGSDKLFTGMIMKCFAILMGLLH